MVLEKIPAAALNPAVYNPRKALKPGDKEFEKLKKSIEDFGYVEPIIWNRTTGSVVGGHQRLAVLRAMGQTEIDCVVVDIDLQREKALNLALNKIDGSWDTVKLRELLEDIDSYGALDMTGFDVAEFQHIAAAATLPEAIMQEKELQAAWEKAEETAGTYEKKIRDIAEQQPERFNHALAVILPSAGGEVLIITDPALKDFVAEVRRLSAAGAPAPLAAVLAQVVSMKWS